MSIFLFFTLKLEIQKTKCPFFTLRSEVLFYSTLRLNIGVANLLLAPQFLYWGTACLEQYLQNHFSTSHSLFSSQYCNLMQASLHPLNSRTNVVINIYIKAFMFPQWNCLTLKRKGVFFPVDLVWKSLQRLPAALHPRQASSEELRSSLIRYFILWNCLLQEK